jgi:hypothetical protein
MHMKFDLNKLNVVRMSSGDGTLLPKNGLRQRKENSDTKLLRQNGKRRYPLHARRCMGLEYNVWFVGVVCFMIILTSVGVIFTILYAGNFGSSQRFCFEALPGNVIPGPGEVGGVLWGNLELHSNEREIKYFFRYVGLSTITAVTVRGPITLGQQVGPLLFSICGAPSTVVCDQITLPGQLSGTLTQISPSNTSPEASIVAIRTNPSLYYVEVLTNNNPTTPGALRAPLNSLCGTP